MARWQKERIEIPSGYSPSDRQRIGKDIVEQIRVRAEGGFGVKKSGSGGFNKKKFPGYSEGYRDSLDFAIAGKSPSKVDLTLSGDMLIALDVISHNSKSVLVGYESGSEENARAEGNQTGSYGQPSGNSRKARPFIGITKPELNSILRKYERRE